MSVHDSPTKAVAAIVNVRMVSDHLVLRHCPCRSGRFGRPNGRRRRYHSQAAATAHAIVAGMSEVTRGSSRRASANEMKPVDGFVAWAVDEIRTRR